MIRTVGAALVGALVTLSAPVFAHEYNQGPIHIGHPWARATAPSAPTAAAYLSLSTTGAADALVSAATPAAKKAELHTHLHENGVMKMRPVDDIPVAPGTPTKLEPGGLHIMLFGLEKPLAAGTSFPLTLTFKQAGTITVDVKVEAAGASGEPQGHQHGGEHKAQ